MKKIALCCLAVIMMLLLVACYNSNYIRCSLCGEENLENSRFCSSCGEVIVSNSTNDDSKDTECKHSYTNKVTIEATCSEDGVKTFTCSNCADTYDEKIAATGEHNYTSEITIEATCTEDGVKTFTCSMCKDSYTESIDAGHKWTTATCTAPKICSLCKVTEGEILEHSYIDATSTTPQTCTRCGHTIGNPIPWYGANAYKVGVDIPEGEYYIKCTSSDIWCYFEICKDSSGDSMIENETFYGHHFVSLENGQYFKLSGGKCTNVDNIKLEVDLKNIAEGMYRVGIDIPAGEYKLNKTSGTFGYLAVYDNSTATRDIRTNDVFENGNYITVYDGEYLYFHSCAATLVQKMSG